MCKALLRICGKAANVPVYAPKAGALPTALHPERFRFVLFDGHGRRHGGKADAVRNRCRTRIQTVIYHKFNALSRI